MKTSLFEKKFAIIPMKCEKCEKIIWMRPYVRVINEYEGIYISTDYCKECADT